MSPRRRAHPLNHRTFAVRLPYFAAAPRRRGRALFLVAVAVGGQVGQVAERALAVAATGAAADAEALDLAGVGEAELGRQLRLVEQADVVGRRPPDRLGRLDLNAPVALEPGGRRDQLADDHVLLQAEQPVRPALERRVRE